MSRVVADARHGRSEALRLVGLRPFNHATGRTDVSDTTFVSYHTLTEDVTDPLVFCWSNFHVNTVGGETSGVPLTLEATVWIYDGATSSGPVHLTFNSGASSASLGGKCLLGCDPAYVGFLKVGFNRIRVHTRVVCAFGSNVPVGTVASGGMGVDGNGVADLVALNPTVVNTGVFCPCAIGTLSKSGMRSGVACLGDSITAGTGESSGVSPFGWLARRLDSLGIGFTYAPKSGESAFEWIGTNARRFGRLRLAGLAPVAVFCYVVNDIQTNRTAAQIKADLLAAWSELASAGCRVYQVTPVPKTTSSDSWSTTAGQTIAYTPSQQAVRAEIMTWLRPGQAATDASGNLVGVLDVAALVEVDATNVPMIGGGLWLVDGTPKKYTSDGLHLSTAGHLFVGSAISPGLGAEWRGGY